MPEKNQEPVSASSLSFFEDLYTSWARDPSSVGPDWKRYFQSLGARPMPMPDGGGDGRGRTQAAGIDSEQGVLQERVDQLVHAYRVRGHRGARLDPLGSKPVEPRELDPAYHGFTDRDMDRHFSCSGFCRDGTLPLEEIVEKLRETYCRSIGVEYMHIGDGLLRDWLQERMESTQNRIRTDTEQQVRILTRLTDAEVFERFLRKKFIGAKTFSLEGAESLIPLLEIAIQTAGAQGVDEIVLAMAHRGRLNVLANILSKSPAMIFRKLRDAEPMEESTQGDVGHHLGHSSDYATVSGKNVHLSLCFSPSHLEFVNPIALGRIRAKQDRVGDTERSKGFALMIHGDAAFAGEGIVQETLNLSGLAAYRTGGSLHVVINNRIGFTTAPSEYTSSEYITGVGKMLQVPIFHVNGEDPEAVVQVVTLAMEFRHAFRRDAIIDMYCYRRLGHNETDEPSFTQPLLYEAIGQRKSVREGYLDTLLKPDGVTREVADRIAEESRERLKQALDDTGNGGDRRPSAAPSGVWEGYSGGPEPPEEIETGVDADRLRKLLLRQTELPPDFEPHPKIRKGMDVRRRMAAGEQPLDWAGAESLAFASLAVEGFRVRVTGQDTARGTFGHRHAVLHDVRTGRTYVPLQHLSPDQTEVEIHNSPLSEAGVLGFEYGYSLDCPKGLIIWEAQFGDFANAAQVIIDQFIASAEDKWSRLSAVTLLLPHGFEGMGPEHSSARLERFLMLAAEDNIQVACPSTPAQYFHLLRRQGLRTWKKPLVVLTPKSLLRSDRSTSSLEECATGRFQRVLPDRRHADRQGVERVLLCSGKIAVDLTAEAERRKTQGVAIVRLEQFYPLDDGVLEDALKGYGEGTPVIWVQEEPANMGAWRYLASRFGDRLPGGHPLSSACRPESASPATGSPKAHRAELEALFAAVFAGD